MTGLFGCAGFALSVAAVALVGCDGAGPDARSNLDQAQIDQMRAACAFHQGALPGLTSARDAPIGDQIPIDTIVIIMMENRSFDHLMSELPAAGQPDVEVATKALSNPDSNGAPVPFHHAPHMCSDDTDHSWGGSHAEYDDGKVDGFVTVNDKTPPPADGTRAMGYYGAADLPFLYSVANTFALADHYHCALLGPTWPNRDYLYAASSFGYTRNTPFANTSPTLLGRLDAARIDWHDYFETFPGTDTLGAADLRHIDPYHLFPAAAAAGQLAPVVFIDADLAGHQGGAGDDFHAPGDVQLGDQFLDDTINTLMASPQWKHMAVFITYDENGGLYDHVPPPSACPPDNARPDQPGALFNRLGFRVPLVVVSPYAKAHYVSHRTYDHTSITRFVESRFVLPSLSRRDANADPLYDLFDFTAPAFSAPPTLAKANVDATELSYCKSQFPPMGP